MISYKLYAAGSFCKSENTLNVVNPHNNQVFAKVAIADEDILEKAILAGIAAQKELRDMPIYQRARALAQIANELEKEAEDFARLICLEAGKPYKYAIGEVSRAVETYRIASEECKRMAAEYIRLDWTEAGTGKEAIVSRFPIGLVAGIAPFNFPLNLTAHKIAPAIAAGNPVILKPASQTPVSILKLAEIFEQTDLPSGAISVLPMSRNLAEKLVVDERIRLLSFTGSPAVGWSMKSKAGKKKVSLELGGNAGVYVSESADIKKAVERCVMGGFAFSGQVCIHVQRIYVHSSIYTEFSKLFLKAVGEITEGDPLSKDTDIASLIDQENAVRVEAWVQEAIHEGATLLAGGQRVGSYYPPTVLSQTRNSMKVCAMEVFGPVVTLEKVEKHIDAISQINSSRFGLQAGIFTDSLEEMNYAYRNLEVGGVVVNDVPTFRVDHMPYGGVKDSGIGREGIKYAIEEMTEPRLLIKPI